MFKKYLLIILGLLYLLGTACQPSVPKGDSIKVGLIAPLTGNSAASGEAIRRGMLIAMEEINASGGVLDRPMELVVRDVANDQEAGVAALQDLIDNEQIVAVFGGLFSPVMLAQQDLLYEKQIPLINAWGSVTAITDNGRNPNYSFRVSVSDKYADEFLVRYALENLNMRFPAIIADTSAWGDSNIEGLMYWLDQFGISPATIQRFDQGDTNMSSQVQAIVDSGADIILMVANAPEGAAIVRAKAVLGLNVPVISHWGISGGAFVQAAGVENAEGIYTLQTYSFYNQQSDRGKALVTAYNRLFKTVNIDEITAPVGVVHGYDGVHLLALAIQQAGSTSGPKIREALETLNYYEGVVKVYNPAFTSERHDALLANDYIMTVWKNGKLVPADPLRLNP